MTDAAEYSVFAKLYKYIAVAPDGRTMLEVETEYRRITGSATGISTILCALEGKGMLLWESERGRQGAGARVGVPDWIGGSR